MSEIHLIEKLFTGLAGRTANKQPDADGQLWDATSACSAVSPRRTLAGYTHTEVVAAHGDPRMCGNCLILAGERHRWAVLADTETAPASGLRLSEHS